jgi:uncharacterized membrane protein YhhN
MEMAFGPGFWALAGVSALAALTYGLFFLNRPPSFLRAVVKTMFMGALTAAFVNADAPFPLLVTLGAATAGDFFLAFDKKWTLPLGILAFLTAQLAYLIIFFGLWMFAPDNAPLAPRYAMMAAVVLGVGAYLVWFWSEPARGRVITSTLAVLAALTLGAAIPFFLLAVRAEPSGETLNIQIGLGALVLVAIALFYVRRDLGVVRLVGMIYAAVIVEMALAAMWLTWRGWPAMLGVTLFLISDLVLSAELFRLPENEPIRRLTAPIVWWTYASAQALIVLGIVLSVGVMV